MPVLLLFRRHWRGLLLQFLVEAAYGCSFYTVFSWLPLYIEKSLHVMTRTGLWAVLIGLVLYSIAVPLTGRFVGDTHARKMWAYLAATAVGAAAIMPVMLVIETGYPVGVWLLLPLLLGLTGVQGGCMTTIGPQIYPPAVRTTGYNLGHNLTMSLFGGVAPLAISALSVVLKPASHAAGVVVIMSTVLSVAAGLALAGVAPATNAPCPAGGYAEYVAAKERARQLQQVVVAAKGSDAADA
jgi:MHS family proline/betaine transporter-like MFS transporter